MVARVGRKYQALSSKMMKRYNMIFSVIGVLLIAFFSACKTEEFYFQEPGKNIAGKWKIVKVTRNGADITQQAGGQFEITFHENGSGYALSSSSLPFVVSKNGTWSFDDPAYPFAISFRPEGGSGEIAVPFLFPVSNGKRQLQFDFSPGCAENTYQYILEKDATTN